MRVALGDMSSVNASATTAVPPSIYTLRNLFLGLLPHADGLRVSSSETSSSGALLLLNVDVMMASATDTQTALRLLERFVVADGDEASGEAAGDQASGDGCWGGSCSGEVVTPAERTAPPEAVNIASGDEIASGEVMSGQAASFEEQLEALGLTILGVSVVLAEYEAPSPPPPPLMPGARVEHKTLVEMEASGDVSDYDSASTVALARKFATLAGVSLSKVGVTVRAASVVIAVEIQVASADAASALVNTIGAKLSSASAASAFTGLPITAAPTISAVSTAVSAPAAPPPPSTPPRALSNYPPPPTSVAIPPVTPPAAAQSGSAVPIVIAGAASLSTILAAFLAVYIHRNWRRHSKARALAAEEADAEASVAAERADWHRRLHSTPAAATSSTHSKSPPPPAEYGPKPNLRTRLSGVARIVIGERRALLNEGAAAAEAASESMHRLLSVFKPRSSVESRNLASASSCTDDDALRGEASRSSPSREERSAGAAFTVRLEQPWRIQRVTAADAACADVAKATRQLKWIAELTNTGGGGVGGSPSSLGVGSAYAASPLPAADPPLEWAALIRLTAQHAQTATGALSKLKQQIALHQRKPTWSQALQVANVQVAGESELLSVEERRQLGSAAFFAAEALQTLLDLAVVAADDAANRSAIANALRPLRYVPKPPSLQPSPRRAVEQADDGATTPRTAVAIGCDPSDCGRSAVGGAAAGAEGADFLMVDGAGHEKMDFITPSKHGERRLDVDFGPLSTGRARRLAFSAADEGKRVSIKGKSVVVGGIARTVNWGEGCMPPEVSGIITEVVEAEHGEVTLRDGSSFPNRFMSLARKNSGPGRLRARGSLGGAGKGASAEALSGSAAAEASCNQTRAKLALRRKLREITAALPAVADASTSFPPDAAAAVNLGDASSKSLDLPAPASLPRPGEAVMERLKAAKAGRKKISLQLPEVATSATPTGRKAATDRGRLERTRSGEIDTGLGAQTSRPAKLTRGGFQGKEQRSEGSLKNLKLKWRKTACNTMKQTAAATAAATAAGEAMDAGGDAQGSARPPALGRSWSKRFGLKRDDVAQTKMAEIVRMRREQARAQSRGAASSEGGASGSSGGGGAQVAADLLREREEGRALAQDPKLRWRRAVCNVVTQRTEAEVSRVRSGEAPSSAASSRRWQHSAFMWRYAPRDAKNRPFVPIKERAAQRRRGRVATKGEQEASGTGGGEAVEALRVAEMEAKEAAERAALNLALARTGREADGGESGGREGEGGESGDIESDQPSSPGLPATAVDENAAIATHIAAIAKHIEAAEALALALQADADALARVCGTTSISAPTPVVAEPVPLEIVKEKEEDVAVVEPSREPASQPEPDLEAELDELEETAPEEEPEFEPEQVPPPGVTPAEGAAALGHGAMLGGGADLKKSAVRV